MRRTLVAILTIGVLGGLALRPAAAQENDECLECHSLAEMGEDAGEDFPLIDEARFAASIHGDVECITCHADLEGADVYDHDVPLKRVDCGVCHEEGDGAIATYWASQHGRQLRAGDAQAPHCQDCHGGHYVLPLADPHSAVSPFNIPRMCAQCHAEDSPVERTHDLPQEQVFQRYRDSIHGEGLFKQGLTVTAVCTSCHTGHNVLPHDDPRSSIHASNIVGTCMQCHGLIEEVHRKIVAGELWEREGAVPVCVECHEPHEIRKVFYPSAMSNADCMRCHAREDVVASADGRSLYVDPDSFAESVHGRKLLSCAQCHTDVTPSHAERPCATIEAPVSCAACHEEVAQQHAESAHGRLLAEGDADAPGCLDCHERHHILEHEAPPDAPVRLHQLVRTSPTFSRNVPQLCAKCHRHGAAAAVRIAARAGDVVESYAMSIHAKGLQESGLTVTAMCTDCHTAHHPLPASDPASTVNVQNIPATCGTCHDGIYEQFQQSVHSPQGNPDYQPGPDDEPLPGCADCHSSHSVARTDVADFKRSIVEQCGRCHEYITETYFETNHGQRSRLDSNAAAARCYDCHGAHNILPTDDRASTLSRENIVATCGKCHGGSHRQFAGYLTHATHHDPAKYPALHYAWLFMTSLLVGTFSFFGLHTLLWLPRAFGIRRELHAALRAAPQKQFVQRFSPLNRTLHLTVIISFFGLAITGMMIKFSYTGWAAGLARLLGGVETAGWIHRVCAVITFGYFLTHIIELTVRRKHSGRSTWRFVFGPDTMLPTWRDAVDFANTTKWFLGLGPRPRYGRWTYWEKFDYFAVFWGVTIIGLTGLCLWFPVSFTRVLPGWAINIAQIVHSDEALLATGFIFTIHFFNSHFRPDKFPMDVVIFTGSMPLEEFKHDRPREYDELMKAGTMETRLVPAPSPGLVRAGAGVRHDRAVDRPDAGGGDYLLDDLGLQVGCWRSAGKLTHSKAARHAPGSGPGDRSEQL